jgi:hypothetical protein
MSAEAFLSGEFQWITVLQWLRIISRLSDYNLCSIVCLSIFVLLRLHAQHACTRSCLATWRKIKSCMLINFPKSPVFVSNIFHLFLPHKLTVNTYKAHFFQFVKLHFCGNHMLPGVPFFVPAIQLPWNNVRLEHLEP